LKARDIDLDRLLRSAANAPEQSAGEAPFGFDTRIIALWRAGGAGPGDTRSVTRVVRLVGALASIVMILAGAGAYRQFVDNEQQTAVSTNEYAIADSAIQTEFLR